jgi:hypothetical protein
MSKVYVAWISSERKALKRRAGREIVRINVLISTMVSSLKNVAFFNRNPKRKRARIGIAANT